MVLQSNGVRRVRNFQQIDPLKGLQDEWNWHGRRQLAGCTPSAASANQRTACFHPLTAAVGTVLGLVEQVLSCVQPQHGTSSVF